MDNLTKVCVEHSVSALCTYFHIILPQEHIYNVDTNLIVYTVHA